MVLCPGRDQGAVRCTGSTENLARSSFMPADERVPDAIHFRSLCLENMRAFGTSQSLNFVDEHRGPACQTV